MTIWTGIEEYVNLIWQTGVMRPVIPSSTGTVYPDTGRDSSCTSFESLQLLPPISPARTADVVVILALRKVLAISLLK
jgi:hypothetical protein